MANPFQSVPLWPGRGPSVVYHQPIFVPSGNQSMQHPSSSVQSLSIPELIQAPTVHVPFPSAENLIMQQQVSQLELLDGSASLDHFQVAVGFQHPVQQSLATCAPCNQVVSASNIRSTHSTQDLNVVNHTADFISSQLTKPLPQNIRGNNGSTALSSAPGVEQSSSPSVEPVSGQLSTLRPGPVNRRHHQYPIRIKQHCRLLQISITISAHATFSTHTTGKHIDTQFLSQLCQTLC